MKADKTYISLETAKLLKDCGIESKQRFSKRIDDEDIDFILCESWMADNNEIYKSYPAFTWQEILWEYAKEFFGSKMVGYGEDANEKRPREILQLLQQQKYNEADFYFRQYCILIKN